MGLDSRFSLLDPRGLRGLLALVKLVSGQVRANHQEFVSWLLLSKIGLWGIRYGYAHELRSSHSPVALVSSTFSFYSTQVLSCGSDGSERTPRGSKL